MKTNYNTTKTLLLLSFIWLTAFSLYGQKIDYVSYPIETRPSDTERPVTNNNRDANLGFGTGSQIFLSGATNAMWPYKQVECFPFLADFYSSGGTVSNNVVLGVSVTDESSGAIVFSDSVLFDEVLSGSLTENTLFDNCFLPDGSITNYTITYTIDSDCVDPNPNNNQESIPFETNEYTFSKETGGTQTIAPAAANWQDGEPHSWSFGNCYFVKESATTSEAIFSIGNASANGIAGRILVIKLYKWIEDTNMDQNMDPDEREAVGFGFYEIEGLESATDLLSVELTPFNGDSGPVELEAQTNYVLMLEYDTADEESLFFVASDEYNYGPQYLASIETGNPRYALMLAIGFSEDQSFNSIGFGLDLVPVARITLDPEIVDNVDEFFGGTQTLAISPNPANNKVHIQIPEISTDGQLTIYDQFGRLISQYSVKPLLNQQVDLDVSYFANGLYFTQFAAKETAISGSFIVIH